MKKTVHLAAAVLGLCLIAVFFLSTVLVELFGSAASVASVKRLIVFPGLFVLVPALAAAGGSGFTLAKTRSGSLVEAKKRRMPFIAMNGRFYAVQALELAAGGLNLFLMSLNLRDGLRLSGRHTRTPQAAPHVR